MVMTRTLVAILAAMCLLVVCDAFFLGAVYCKDCSHCPQIRHQNVTAALSENLNLYFDNIQFRPDDNVNNGYMLGVCMCLCGFASGDFCQESDQCGVGLFCGASPHLTYDGICQSRCNDPTFSCPKFTRCIPMKDDTAKCFGPVVGRKCSPTVNAPVCGTASNGTRTFTNRCFLEEHNDAYKEDDGLNVYKFGHIGMCQETVI